MHALITLASPFIRIVAHRAGPQHLPASRFLLGLVIVLHVAVYYAAMLVLDVPAPRSVALPVVDTIVQGILFSALLLFLGLQARLWSEVDASDPLYGLRNDDYLELKISRFF